MSIHLIEEKFCNRGAKNTYKCGKPLLILLKGLSIDIKKLFYLFRQIKEMKNGNVRKKHGNLLLMKR